MIIEKVGIGSLALVSIDKINDNRGFFARCFCKNEFLAEGIEFDVKQCNYSYNNAKYTLRGLHYQNPPFLEAKIVTCIKGRIFDVAVDLRKGSETYLEWKAFELSSESYQSLFIPKGFAHGFLTLESDTCVFYQMSEYYHKGYESGIRYDEPTLGINWPEKDLIVISEKDRSLPYLSL